MRPTGSTTPRGRFGPYLIESEIGRGGMGAVYLARHAETGARHALKVILQSKLADDAGRAVARFQREVEVLARIEPHENLVRVHSAGVAAGLPWCSMDLVEGRSLAAHLANGPLRAEDAARLVATLARAVHHVHGYDVLHRDLKPENVLIDAASGAPRIVDFGLAYDLVADRLTRTGELVGTPAFMAPEQVTRGSSEAPTALGPRTDVYALGAILYAALAGGPPFRGSDAIALVLEILRADPPPLRRRNPAAPSDLDTVCVKALAKRPEDRYPSALALAQDLERWLAGESVTASATGASRVRRLLRIIPRSGAGLAAAGVLAMAIGVAIVAVVIVGRDLETPTASAAQSLDALERSLAEQGRLSLDEIGELAAIVESAPSEADGRRAKLLDRVARLLTAGGEADREEHADAIAELVRPDGELDAALLERAVSLLHGHGRLRALDAVLHGATPVATAPDAVATDLARAMVPDEPSDADVAPPDDAAAFEALVTAPGLEDGARGRLLVRRADRFIARTPPDHETALDALETAFRQSGAVADGRRWPAAFRRFALETFIARVRDRVPSRRLAALLVRSGGGDAPLPADLLAALERLIGVDVPIGAGLRSPSADEARTVLLVGSVLEGHGAWPIHTDSNYGVYPVLDADELRELAEAELALPEEQRNPARMLMIAHVLRKTPHAAERSRLVEAARSCGIDEAWFHVMESRSHDGPTALKVEAIERAYALLELRPEAEQWPIVPSGLSRRILDMEPTDPDRYTPERAATFAMEGFRIQKAAWARIAEVSAAGGMASWYRVRESDVILTLTRIGERFVHLDPPRCCGAPERGVPSPEDLAAAALELADRPMARLTAAVKGGDRGSPVARLYAIRANHHRVHDRLDEALAAVDEAIAEGRLRDEDVKDEVGLREEILEQLAERDR